MIPCNTTPPQKGIFCPGPRKGTLKSGKVPVADDWATGWSKSALFLKTDQNMFFWCQKSQKKGVSYFAPHRFCQLFWETKSGLDYCPLRTAHENHWSKKIDQSAGLRPWSTIDNKEWWGSYSSTVMFNTPRATTRRGGLILNSPIGQTTLGSVSDNTG
jgi:hypothetical protein